MFSRSFAYAIILACGLYSSSAMANMEDFPPLNELADNAVKTGSDIDIVDDSSSLPASNSAAYAGPKRSGKQLPSDFSKNELIDELTGKGENNEALAEKDITIKNFSLNESGTFISEKIASNIEQKNILVDGLAYKRVGGNRVFTQTQIDNVNLNTKFLIKDIDIREKNSRFTASLKPVAGDYMIEVSGNYSMSKKLPVLSRNISKGSKITQDDIELKTYPEKIVASDTITDVSQLLGKAASKALSKGKVIATADVKNAVVISKNSTVSALYKTDSIEIKTLAIALEDGGEGDLINMKNFDSGKNFKAVVQADGNVLIGRSADTLSLNVTDANSGNNIN